MDPTGIDLDRWWQALQVSITVNLLCAPVSWVDDGITPSWIVYPVLLAIAWWRVRRAKGALMTGVVALVFLVVHLPFSWAAVSGAETAGTADVPTSPVQWLVTLFIVPALTSAIGWITWLRQRNASSAPVT